MTFPLLILSAFCYLQKISTKSNYQLPEGPPVAPDRRMKGFLQNVNSSFFLNMSLTLLGGQEAVCFRLASAKFGSDGSPEECQ